MNIHKNLRYLLVGGLALTSLVSYSNDNRANGIDYHKQQRKLEKEKAKLEEDLKALQEKNPGINITPPGFGTKLLYIAGLSLVGGIYDATIGVPLRLDHINLENESINPFDDQSNQKPKKLLSVTQCFISGMNNVKNVHPFKKTAAKILICTLFRIPTAVAVVCDTPKLLQTRFTQGQVINRELEERHDARSALDTIIKYVSVNLLMTKLDEYIGTKLPSEKKDFVTYDNSAS